MSVGSKTRFVLRNTLVPVVGWERWNIWQHHVLHRYQPNFRDPGTFLEYLQYTKYYGFARELGPLVDKFAVKEYVRRAVDPDIVIPTIEIIGNAGEFDLNKLPSRWIAKSVHAAGWNYIFDGHQENEAVIRARLARWLKKNYWCVSGEVNYRYIPPRVMFEPLIVDRGEDLIDYKVWCFAGKAHFIGVHGDRKVRPRGQIFNRDWTPSRWRYPEIPDWSGREIPKPVNESELIGVAERLSAPFPFVRVDLYEVHGRIYFGELTFTPGDGVNIRIPRDEDERYGSIVAGARGAARVEVPIAVPANDLLNRSWGG